MLMHDGLLSRRTVHDYQVAPVPDDVIARALTAAHHAPCHRFTWPWRFVVAGPVARRAVTELGLAVKAAKAPLSERQELVARARLANPGALIVACQRMVADPTTREEDYAAVACAVQNLQLCMWADGFGTKWSTGGLMRHPQLAELFGVDLAAERVVGLVWAGVAAKVPTPPRPPATDFWRQTL